MSYLTPPRLTFFGQSYANASTANNNDVASVYDVDTLTLNPAMALISGATAISPAPPGGNSFQWSSPTDNPALRTWLMGYMNAPGVDGVGQAQMAHWNYYGDHGTEFRRAHVSSGMTSTGPAAASDPINGTRVELLGSLFYGKRRGGVLVDVDPYALVTSQIFSGQFVVSYRAGPRKYLPLIVCDDPTVAYSYFINPFKNLNPSCKGFEAVSAVFQFAIPQERVHFHPTEEFNSPMLSDLVAKAQAGRGLMVRFCLYDAIFNIQAADLFQDFAKGDYVANPYEGRVLGSIGVWYEDEPASAPPGRKLRIQNRYSFTPPRPSMAPARLAEKTRQMALIAKYRERPPVAPGTLPTATLGQTLAAVDTLRCVVSLDCISTFPEANIRNRDKFDLGPINLVLLYGTPPAPGQLPPNSVTIGPVPNDKVTYETGGGVVDISYATNPEVATINANIGSGQLALYGVNQQIYFLIETPGTDTQTDNRAVYFDLKTGQGSGAIPGTSQIAIRVSQRGQPPSGSVTLNLEYWMCEKDLVNPDKPQVPVVTRYFSVAGATPITATPYTLGYLAQNPKYPGGQVNVLTDQVVVPAGGRLTLNLTALQPGVSMIRFVDPTLQPPPAPNFAWDNCDFAVVRILPFDDFSSYTDEQINNWPFIYANVFGFYSVLYPVMSNVIPWGPNDAPNNPTEVSTFASQIAMLTSADLWYSTLYMPITRDLSGGKRLLLQRWCNLQQATTE